MNYKNNSIAFLCIIALQISLFAQAQLRIVDSIVEVISSEQGTKLITQSDLDRSALSGGMKTLENLRFEASVMLDAQKISHVATDEDVEAYLVGVMNDNNINQSQMRGLFGSAGYTYDEGLEQLRISQTTSNMIGAKVHANVTVARKEVEAYYNAHPEYIPAKYTIARAILPIQIDDNINEQLELLQNKIIQRDIAELQWTTPIMIEEKDLAEDKKFLTKIEVGHISEPKKIAQGLEVFHLIAKESERLLTLDERYFSIMHVLQQPRYEELFAQYKDEMEQSVSVIHFTPHLLHDIPVVLG